jgi:hypothetical protein
MDRTMLRSLAPLLTIALLLAACTKPADPQRDAPTPASSPSPSAAAAATTAPPASASASAAPSPPSPSPSAAWPKADLASFDAMNASDDPMHKTVILELRDFKALSNVEVAARSCTPVLSGFDRVRIEVTKLPSGAAKKLVATAGCVHVYGKITGWTGGGPNGLKFVDVSAILDGG